MCSTFEKESSACLIIQPEAAHARRHLGKEQIVYLTKVSENQIQPQRQNNRLNQNTQATIMAHLAILGTHPHHPPFCAWCRPPWFFCQGFSVRRTQTAMMAFFAEQYMLESLTIQGGGRVLSVLLLLLGSHVLLASSKTYSDPISCHAQCRADLSHNVVSCNNTITRRSLRDLLEKPHLNEPTLSLLHNGYGVHSFRRELSVLLLLLL